MTASNPRLPASDPDWVAATRATLFDAEAAFAARFDAGEDIDRLLRARASAMDAVVRDAWDRCLGAHTGLALFAVGGYGHGELFPQSDIDLLVITDEASQARHGDALARFCAALWDAGVPLGHAVRSPAQNDVAIADITVFTAQLDARLLHGDTEDLRALADAIAPERRWPAREFFEAKRQELRDRHARFGDTSDNLEPNLKEGPGGLRDLQTLRWMARRVAGTRDLESLVAMGQLGPDEFATLDTERRALSRLRWGLHLVARRCEERLRFDHQKALAERLGHRDEADTLAVERMMQGFYISAARVQRIGDRLLQRFEEQLEGEAEPVPLDDRFELRRGYLAARDLDWPHARAPQPGRTLMHEVFALFAAWAADPEIRGLHSRTARALAEALRSLVSYGDATQPQREAFLALLRGPQPVKALERMARLGVLGRWLPAFARVSGRMQFDLFHVYTVDQHTLAVLRNIAGFASGQPDARFAIAHDVWPRLHKPELLLLAGLFHDIAKGRGGDHSELGAEDARDFCSALGLPQADVELVAWLVERHLLMSTTAQKQDIADPEVIHRFADTVGDRDRLDYLYLLTCADIAGTSPKLWNAWKDRLLADLYTATRQAFRRGLEHHPVTADERLRDVQRAVQALLQAQGLDEGEVAALFARMPRDAFLRGRPDQLAWQALALRGVESGDTRVRVRRIGEAAQSSALEVFVHSPDRDGLFAAIVATLDRLGLAIQRARVLDGPERTIFDTFDVLPADPARPVDAMEVERKLQAVLSSSIASVRPARRSQPRHLRHFRIAPQVGFDRAGSRTLMSLVCTDRPGLLADIAQVLRAQRLRVHDARIATFGERAEDVFRITDERNRALDQERQHALREALLQALDGDRAK
jgi:[protein-PII] uridylyltransferase